MKIRTLFFLLAATPALAFAQADTAKTPAPKPVPFDWADWTWLTGNARTKDSPLDSKAFTGEFRLDATYLYDFANPVDHTLTGSSEQARTQEFQVTQLGVGGDFHYDNVRGRIMTQFGIYSQLVPRNDASPSRGQWNLGDAYRYISEAYGGYHFDHGNGINVDAGIFMSYVGLYSYYNFDNWSYQPSYVSSNTPWFFNGVRIQTFPTQKLKLEYWIINGWQSYGMFNSTPGLGMQVLYRPNSSLSMLSNNYWGYDTPGNSSRMRVHSDNSIQVKYHEDSTQTWSKAAFSVTVDMGCESGGGVTCGSGSTAAPGQYFLGFMVYSRNWFNKDKIGLTIGGGAIDNPGRYLVLLPPVNGATATSGTPYFTANPGDQYHAWDASVTLDYMPSQFLTWRWEFNYRASSVPYFAGAGGVTPPGGNTGSPGSTVNLQSGALWSPDLRKSEARMTLAVLVKM
jgi:hypothetical protein